MEPKSHPMLLTKKQMTQEVERLTTELQLITNQRNELLDRPTVISEDTMENRSSLHYASAHNHPNVVRLLSSNDSIDINMKDDEGCTPLIKAVQWDNVECICILLIHGADPHIVDANGDAALHHAICRGNIRAVSKLLEYNVDIKAKTEYGLTPYKLALFENQLEVARFLIENGADAHSELTPYRISASSPPPSPISLPLPQSSPPPSSARRATRVPCPVRRPRTTHLHPGLVSGGAAALESEQSMKTCANFNKEENFSTDIMPSCSEGTITREPEQRKEKCVTFNDEIHYNTDKKPFCSGIRPSGELKPILKKSLQISGDNGRNKKQISLRLSENPHVTTEDKATTSAIKEDIDNSSSRYTIIQKQILYSKKIVAMKKRDQEGLSKSVMDLSTQGEALPEFSRKKSCLMVQTKKEEGFLPPSNMHDIVPQPSAHADVTSTSHVSERGDNRQSSEETTVNNTSMDHTPSLGDTLDPQNACMRVLASSPADCTSYAGNTRSKVYLIWAATTSLLLLRSSVWLLHLVALMMMMWILNQF